MKLARSPIRHFNRQPSWLSLIIKAIVAGVFILAVLFVWLALTVPDPSQLTERVMPQSTKIYDRTGKILLYEFFSSQRRTKVSLSDIPSFVQQATIAVEDKTFYEHKGFNLARLVKVIIFDVLTLSKAQGASTITQQLVKNAILTREKTIVRKIKELILSYRLEKDFTKDQILEMYFNEIPYGSNVYGIESASQSYFGKGVKDLTLAEGALLASLPQAPTYYSPYGSHLEELFSRQQLIISLMADQGYVSKEQAETAVKQKITFRPKLEKIKAPHFVFYVKELLVDRYGEERLKTGGFKVITSLDMDKQALAEKVITEQTESNKKYNANNASLVAIDAPTGQLLAMVGSRDYFNEAIDGNVNVALRPRQPGSSFKPVVYATAFSKGYTPTTVLYDVFTSFPTDTGKPYEPRNYDLKERGPVTLRKALAGSLNIPAVKLLYLAGVPNVLDTASRLGYTTLNDRSRFGLSLVLGGGEVKLLEHTNAFATFAREGIYKPTTAILRVEDNKGSVLEEWKEEEGRQVLPVEAVRNLTDILSDNNSRAYIFGTQNYLTLTDHPVAAKTGTTNDYRDAWTVGYTPSLAVGVWVGNSDNKEMKRGADGSIIAAPIWQAFMKEVVQWQPVETFNKPLLVNTGKPILDGQSYSLLPAKTDKYLNQIIPSWCLNDYPQEYITDGGYPEAHSILRFVNKDDPQGPVPSQPESDLMYKPWEEAVQRWLKGNNLSIPSTTPLNDCSIRSKDNQPSLTVLYPKDNSIISTTSFVVDFQASAKRGVRDVKAFLDGQLAGSTNQTDKLNVVLPNVLSNGFHLLSVAVYDDVLNQTTVSLSVTVAVPGRIAGSSLFRWDDNNQKTFRALSAFSLSFSLTDPSQVKTVDFFVKNNGVERFVGTISNPAKENNITLNQTLLVGYYTVTPLVTLTNGQSVNASPLFFSIQ
ncbi:MAG: PBP1A family penicillin-binding protein [bacterium]